MAANGENGLIEYEIEMVDKEDFIQCDFDTNLPGLQINKDADVYVYYDRETQQKGITELRNNNQHIYEGNFDSYQQSSKKYIMEFDDETKKCKIRPLKVSKMLPKMKTRYRSYPSKNQNASELSLQLISAFGNSKSKRNMQNRLDTLNKPQQMFTEGEQSFINTKNTSADSSLFSQSLIENWYLPIDESAFDRKYVVEFEKIIPGEMLNLIPSDVLKLDLAFSEVSGQQFTVELNRIFKSIVSTKDVNLENEIDFSLNDRIKILYFAKQLILLSNSNRNTNFKRLFDEDVPYELRMFIFENYTSFSLSQDVPDLKNAMSDKQKDKLICHIIALLTCLNGFKIEVNAISNIINCKAERIANLVKIMRFSINLPIQNKQFISLKLPLPSIPSFGKRSRYRNK